MQTGTHTQGFEASVRAAVIQQLQNQQFVDAMTSAVIQSMEAAEDAALAGILSASPANEPVVDIDQFLKDSR